MEKTMTLNTHDEEQKLLIEELIKVNTLKTVADLATKNYEVKKKAVYDMAQQYMETKKVDTITFSFSMKEHGIKSLYLRQIKNKKILWSVDKLLNVLSDTQAEKVINKKYEVTSWKALSEVMKNHNVKPSEVTPYINVEKTVNEDALEQLHSLGEIKEDDIKECYSVITKSSYLKMSSKRNNSIKD